MVTGIRLVLTPEQVVLAEARRSLTTLSLFGYRVDGVVVNRVFPDDGADPWRAGWVRAQAEVLAEVHELEDRYGVSDFEAVDNILDMGYHKTLLPALAADTRTRQLPD